MNPINVPRAAAAAIAALAIAAPVAQADPDGPALPVCNEASPHFVGGTFTATDGDPNPPARYTIGLELLPGNGDGLVNAASHSPALSVCAPVSQGGGDPS